MMLSCPHCDRRMQIRTSRQLSEFTRELLWQCVNIECGHTCHALLSITRTLNPSRNPRPQVYLPVGKIRRLPQNRRQLELVDT
jgi:hypothetical protein